MGKPSEIDGAKFGGSEGKSIVSIIILLCRIHDIGTM
jgi:hypothetical protein